MKKNILLLSTAIIATGTYFYFSNPDANQGVVVKKIEQELQLVEKKQEAPNIVQNSEKTKPWQSFDKDIPIMDYFDELMEAANNGDADAQYHLALAHRYCFPVPEEEEQLNKSFASVDTKGKEYLGSNEAVQGVMIKKYDWCKGYPRNKLSNGRWNRMIISAARGGNSYAKIEFLRASLGLIDPKNYYSQAETIVEIKAEGLIHLTDSRSMGNFDSLAFLGNAYEKGGYGPIDYLEAYANYYAFSLISGTEVSSRFRERFEDRLSNEEIEQAILRGERYSECCN